MAGGKTHKTRQEDCFAGAGRDQGRVTDGYFRTNRHGSGAQRGKKDATLSTVNHGLLHGWSTHAAAAESVEPLWEGRGQGWLLGLNRKRSNYLSSSEDTGGGGGEPLPGPILSSSSDEEVDKDGGDVAAPESEKNLDIQSPANDIEDVANRGKQASSETSGSSCSPVPSAAQEPCSHNPPDDGNMHIIDDDDNVVDIMNNNGRVSTKENISDVASSKEGNGGGNSVSMSPPHYRKRRQTESVAQMHTSSRQDSGHAALKIYKDDVSNFDVDDLNRSIIKKNRVLFNRLVRGMHLLHSKKSSGLAPLICACRYGDDYMLKTLVESGSLVNITDHSGKTPLIYAVERGNLDMVKILLDNGAGVHHTCPEGLTALHYAIENDSEEITKLLIDAGSPLDYRCPGSKTVLMKACRSSKSRVVLALLAAGSSVDIVDDQGQTALMLCLAGGVRSNTILSALIEAGTVEYLNKVDYRGRSALVLAIMNKITSAAGKLLRMGCKFDYFCSFSGKWPLILAIKHKQHSCVSWMLRHGANPDCEDQDGKTALMYAAELGYGQMVADLVHAGARIDAIDQRTKFSALDYAAYHGNTQSARILLKEEGKILPE